MKLFTSILADRVEYPRNKNIYFEIIFFIKNFVVVFK